VPSDTAPGDKGFGRGLGGASSKELANALGISVDELTAAYQEARDAALDQAVQAGLITQAQADEIRSRGGAFPLGGRWRGWLSENGIDVEALLADALGISVDELHAAQQQAAFARIDQAVTDGRITQEQADLMKGQYALSNSESFRSAMQSAFEAAVQQAVTDGVITQAQADAILAQSAEGGFPGWHGFGGGRGPGGFGRHGGRGGAPSDPATPETPTTTPAPSGL
jgi:hypothetical protein